MKYIETGETLTMAVAELHQRLILLKVSITSHLELR